MRKSRFTPGERLKEKRLSLGLSLRDVHAQSLKLALKLGNKRFILPPSRLHDLEMKHQIPRIHRLYTLAHVYGYDVRELLSWYGMPRS